MPSPFPGMDPFLESQGFWQDFHTSLLTYCRESLNTSLPGHYAALMEERISLVDLTGEALAGFRPDVSIVRGDRGPAPRREEGGVATLEPVSVPLARKDLDEVRERWIEIKRLPDLSLVTVIEILSPTNKIGAGPDRLSREAARVPRPAGSPGGDRPPAWRPPPAHGRTGSTGRLLRLRLACREA